MFARKAHMTAQTTGALPWPDQGSRGARRVVRPVAGVLADGTPYFAPIGEIVSDGATVTCHLCGRSLKSVAAHLRAHGWTKAAYCQTFGLERGQPLEGQETRKRRAASVSPRPPGRAARRAAIARALVNYPGMRPGPARAVRCPSSAAARPPGPRPPPP